MRQQLGRSRARSLRKRGSTVCERGLRDHCSASSSAGAELAAYGSDRNRLQAVLIRARLRQQLGQNRALSLRQRCSAVSEQSSQERGCFSSSA